MQKRLVQLESQLPEGVATLGVDEHTALIIDRASDTITARGRANGYWRRNGETNVLGNATTSLEDPRTLNPSPPRQLTSEQTPATSRPVELGNIASNGVRPASRPWPNSYNSPPPAAKAPLTPHHS